MTARQLASRLCPPVLLDLLRGRPPVPSQPEPERGGIAPCFIWEGIYARRRDVPSHLGTWDFADRVKDCVEEVHAFHASMAAGILNIDENDAMKVEAVYEALYPDKHDFTTEDILSWLEQHPGLDSTQASAGE
jgi:hypothetical protein